MDLKVLKVIAIIDLVVVLAAPALDVFVSYRIGINGDIALASAVGVIAIVTFIGFIAAAGSEKALQDVMREAIAAAFVSVYLVLVAMTAFFKAIPQDQASSQALNNLTAILIPNFTALTGVVLGFYFGSSAVAAVFGKTGPAGQGQPEPGAGGPQVDARH